MLTFPVPPPSFWSVPEYDAVAVAAAGGSATERAPTTGEPTALLTGVVAVARARVDLKQAFQNGITLTSLLL